MVSGCLANGSRSFSSTLFFGLTILPLMASLSAPGPTIVRFLLMSNCLLNEMTPLTLTSNVIVSPEAALITHVTQV